MSASNREVVERSMPQRASRASRAISSARSMSGIPEPSSRWFLAMPSRGQRVGAQLVEAELVGHRDRASSRRRAPRSARRRSPRCEPTSRRLEPRPSTTCRRRALRPLEGGRESDLPGRDPERDVGEERLGLGCPLPVARCEQCVARLLEGAARAGPRRMRSGARVPSGTGARARRGRRPARARAHLRRASGDRVVVEGERAVACVSEREPRASR